MGTTASIRLEDYEKEALTEYASFLGMSFSDWARQTLFEALEDALDYQIAVKAHEEYAQNPVTYSVEEVAAMLGDDDLLSDA